MKMTTLLFSCNGRMNRLTYLGVQVGAIIVFIIAALLLKLSSPEASAGQDIRELTSQQITPFYLASSIIYALVGISVIWVWIATSVKRLHDRDQSGWWLLVSFIPLLGYIWWIIVCLLLPGTKDDNRFGAVPGKEST